MANQEHITKLIRQYAENTISDEGYAELMAYLNIADGEQLHVAVDEVWKNMDTLSPYSDEDADAFYGRLVANKRFKKTNSGSVLKLWPRIAAVAAAVALIVLGVYFFNAPRHADTPRHPELVSGSQDIAPGKNGATITLGNGKVIHLSDAKSGVMIGKDLKYSDGTEILRSALNDKKKGNKSDEELTASTTKGQTYIFTLPDGTKVWLNADSKLKFAHQFAKKTRTVSLQGEAYFEVAKDQARPFVVKTKDQEVEVLGTHFNVNSYDDEGSEKTTLVEGSVRVRQTGATKNEVILTPGQQATNNHKSLMTSSVNAEEVLDWKNDGFAFNGGDFAAAMRKIARWYNVEIIYDPVAAQKMEIGGFISRKNELSAVLKFIESTEQVKFTIEGRRVLVRN